MRFVLLVEGRTEKALPRFLKRWLDPKLPQPVGITPVKFNGWGDYLNEVADKVNLHLSGDSAAQVVAAIGLIDLYGLEYPHDVNSVNQRYDWAKRDIESKVRHPKFRQHFAVHESEAWILSDPDILPRGVREALPTACSRPETVDFDEPPSALLARLYHKKLGRKYKKVTDGFDLFRSLSPDAARGKCPYLKRLLDEMLDLARQVLL